MAAESRHKQLFNALLERFTSMDLRLTYVIGNSEYENPYWIQWKGSWMLPDIVAEDREQGHIILGKVETEESWDSETAMRNLDILSINAHKVFVMVPEEVINRANLEKSRKRRRNVQYVSPSK